MELTLTSTLINFSEMKSVSVRTACMHNYIIAMLPVRLYCYQLLQLHAIQQTSSVAGEYINTQTFVAHAADCMYI